MRRTSFEDMHCSVAQALEVVGEWWSLLIVRDALLGVTRFESFQRRLGIARNVLQDRLERLVDAEVLVRVPYQDNPPRFDYRLTDKGRDLWPVLTALRQWGDRWAAPDGPPAQMEHRSCGHLVDAEYHCSHCGERLELKDLGMHAGPGIGPGGAFPVPGRD
jgi:DNA-binding HxlR family transcriptional regulator